MVGIECQLELWIDNGEVIRRAKSEDLPDHWRDTLVLDYDLWVLTCTVIQEMDLKVTWNKVDSHIQDKLKIDPTRKLHGNAGAWRLNEAADKLAGEQREKLEAVEEVYFEEAEVMAFYNDSYIYGSVQDRVTEGEHGPSIAGIFTN